MAIDIGDLLLRHAAGDRDASEQLLAVAHKKAMIVAKTAIGPLVRPKYGDSDLAQSTCVAVIADSSWADAAMTKKEFESMVVRKTFDRLRPIVRRFTRSQGWRADREEPIESAEQLADDQEACDALDTLGFALQQLTLKERNALLLHANGWKLDMLAQYLGVHRNTIAGRLEKLRARVRATVEQEVQA